MTDQPSRDVPDPALAEAVKSALNQSTQDLDAQTLTLLREARQKALSARPSTLARWHWPAAAVVALLVLAIIPPWVQQSAREVDAALAMAQLDSEESLTVEEMEMLEDFELIEAIAEELPNEAS